MRTLLAGLRARRWLNLGVLALGVLALLVAVATPLYARSSAEHLLDQRTLERLNTETGLNVQVGPTLSNGTGVFVPAAVTPATDGTAQEQPLSDGDRQAMLDLAQQLVTQRVVSRFWQPPTTYLESQGVLHVGAIDHPMNAYWRDGMCRLAHVVGKCPSAPDEALADPTLLKTLREQVGDPVTIRYTVLDQKGEPIKQPFEVTYTIVGTYTIDDDTDPTWFTPERTGGDGLLRPPPNGSPPLPAPALLVDRSGISVASATVAGADRPIDMTKVDIDDMDQAQADLVEWQARVSVMGPPVIQGADVASLQGVFDDVRSEQLLLSRITLAAIVPLVALALLLLFVLVSSAADVRRQEVALAKLRGFSAARVVRFAVAEPALVLLVAVPVGIALSLVTSRVVTHLWLGQTPFVVTPQAVGSAVVVTAAAFAAAFAAVLGVVREPLASSLASVTRRRATSRITVLAQGALVMLAVAAVVQVASSDATESSSFLELLTPLFVALGASVLAMVAVAFGARVWMARTAARGGLSPFLASRRLVRRQDLVQLVLPLLLATSMATFAASAWKVADDWRVSKAAATVGAATVYYTDTSPETLYWVTHQADPDGHYLAALVPPTPRTTEGARVALVDSSRFARVVAWDPRWGDGGPGRVQQQLTLAQPPDPITFSGKTVTFELQNIQLQGKLNLPLELWLRYVSTSDGVDHSLSMGRLPLHGSQTLHGFVSDCEQGCEVEQLLIAGSSSSVTDAHGSLAIAGVFADGDQPGDWRLTDPRAWRAARPFPPSNVSPVRLTGSQAGLQVEIGKGDGTIVRFTTTDIPAAPPVVATDGTTFDKAGNDAVNGASLVGTRTPMKVTGRAVALPVVGNDGGLSDLGAALREYGDQSTNVPLTELLVAKGTPASVLTEVRNHGVDLSTVRTEADELQVLRTDAFSLGWRVFLIVGVLTLLLAFLGVLTLAVVQLRWRAYEVAALRVVGVRRRDLRRAVVTEYVALLGMAVGGGVLSAIASLLLVLPSLDIGVVGTYDPPVDYGLRWLVLGGVVAVVLVVVLAIAWWISRRTIKLGTPATLRQADQR